MKNLFYFIILIIKNLVLLLIIIKKYQIQTVVPGYLTTLDLEELLQCGHMKSWADLDPLQLFFPPVLITIAVVAGYAIITPVPVPDVYTGY